MDNNSAILIPKIETVKKDDTPSSFVQSENSNMAVKSEEPKLFKSPTSKDKKKKLFIGLGIFVAILIIFLVPSLLFFTKAKSVYDKLIPLTQQEDYGNLEKIKSDFLMAKNEVSSLKASYSLIAWMKYVPFAGGYVSDLGNGLNASVKVFEAGEIAFTTVDPFLEELGFKEATDTSEKSAQERIDFVVNSIPEILPHADEISKKISEAEMYLSKIDPNRYPEEFRGVMLREKIKDALDMFKSLSKYVSESKPLLENASYLLGMEEDRTYLVLFQNDKELRPTGGFLTAYSVMKVSKAKFEPVVSDDIYNLDSKYKPEYPAPQAIVDLIKGPYILSQNVRLRDTNYNPDFKLSMDMFTKEAEKAGMDGIDGIIAVDTHLLVNILNAIGEIGVPGYGNFSTKVDPRCNCPQVIYELESFADIEGPIIWDPVTGKIILRPPNSDNRKKIIGPLMNSILANALAQPKEKMPDLITAIFKSLTEKHVLFYLYDENAQKAVESFGIAGRIEDYQDGDYLHVSDSNLGGRKSNLYVKHEVSQEYSLSKDGFIQKTVTLTYKNPEKHDGWLNSVLPNWVRIYVPKGSTLVDVQGLEKQYDTTEELNKTVYSGYFKLRPEGVSKVIFTYTLPVKKMDEFKLFIQKQPGTDAPLYTITTDKQEEEFLLTVDKELRIKL